MSAIGVLSRQSNFLHQHIYGQSFSKWCTGLPIFWCNHDIGNEPPWEPSSCNVHTPVCYGISWSFCHRLWSRQCGFYLIILLIGNSTFKIWGSSLKMAMMSSLFMTAYFSVKRPVYPICRYKTSLAYFLSDFILFLLPLTQQCLNLMKLWKHSGIMLCVYSLPVDTFLTMS